MLRRRNQKDFQDVLWLQQKGQRIQVLREISVCAVKSMPELCLWHTPVQPVREVTEPKGLEVEMLCSCLLGIQLETSKLMFLVCRCSRASVALPSVLSGNVLYTAIALQSQALCFLKQATKTPRHIWQFGKDSGA